MKLGFKQRIFAAAAAAGLLSLPALATPMTFEFNMPNWGSVFPAGDTALFGSNAILDVTVDNGGAGLSNQSYAFSNITALSVTTVGGTFADTWNRPPVRLSGASTTFLTTDATGVATLDLLANPLNPVAQYLSLDGWDIQLAQITSDGGFTPFAIGSSLSPPQSATVIGPLTVACNSYCGFEVTGSVLSASRVPEPLTLSIFGAGLAGATAIRRRRKKA